MIPRVQVENLVVKATIPEGPVFKGHEPFLVQDLVISVSATCYQRERRVTPDGQTILAPLPEGIESHSGPEPRRFVLTRHHQGQSTLPRLVALSRSLGVSISKRQVQRLLTERHGGFLAEAQAVLRAGLETAPFVSADDTGARYGGKNGFRTQVGDDWFTWFGTRPSESRLNFLDLLRAGHTDYVLSDAAYDYMRRHDLSAAAIALLIHWEFPRLCRGGSRSLTFAGVCLGHPLMKLRIVSRQSTRTWSSIHERPRKSKPQQVGM